MLRRGRVLRKRQVAIGRVILSYPVNRQRDGTLNIIKIAASVNLHGSLLYQRRIGLSFPNLLMETGSVCTWRENAANFEEANQSFGKILLFIFRSVPAPG